MPKKTAKKTPVKPNLTASIKKPVAKKPLAKKAKPSRKVAARETSSESAGLAPIAKAGLLRKPSPQLFAALLVEGKRELKADLYESAEDTFFHARMVGVLLGKKTSELRDARMGQLEAFAKLLAATN